MPYDSDNTKEKFLATWPGGYRENWAVYGMKSGQKEEDVVAKCLAPFYDKTKDCLEVGCGLGFWTERYLIPNFKTVTALDLLPEVPFSAPNFKYIEVPDRCFTCPGVIDHSVDFVWSFGVFCHLSLEANQEYLHSLFKACRHGAKLALYYSNCERRPVPQNHGFDPDHIQWVKNDYATTVRMVEAAHFINTRDLMPELFDTMIYCEKP